MLHLTAYLSDRFNRLIDEPIDLLQKWRWGAKSRSKEEQL
jgi:hypothetical protein